MNVYFDTSSWNRLVKHPDREKLVHLIHQRQQRVLASVISAGEVLRTSDDLRRQEICSVMRTLHGDGPLLERPFDLARAAGQSILQGRENFQLPLTGPGNYLLSCMYAIQPPPQDEIREWQCNMENNQEKFFEQLNGLDLKSDLQHLPEVLGSDAFLKILCQLPPAKELGTTVSQMRAICEKSDVWKALGAMLAYMIKPSTTHASKNKNGKKRPGARDLWQAPYLGVVEVFVTDDQLMLDAISEISGVALVRYPRRIERSDSFFESK